MPLSNTAFVGKDFIKLVYSGEIRLESTKYSIEDPFTGSDGLVNWPHAFVDGNADSVLIYAIKLTPTILLRLLHHRDKFD